LIYLSGIIAFACLIGFGITMPHPLTGGNEMLNDIYFYSFGAFAGLTIILNTDNK